MVATRVGGVPELFREGQEGLLVAPHQPAALAAALLALVGDEPRRRRLGAAAARRAQEYSVEKMIEKLEALYMTLLQEKV